MAAVLPPILSILDFGGKTSIPWLISRAAMRITVVGTGYVGLVAGACFADTGNDVVCLDVDASKIDMLKRGEIPIYEPGLDALVKRGAAEGRLKFTTSYTDAIPGTEVIFLAVGTPPLPSGEPDMKYIKQAAEQVAS